MKTRTLSSLRSYCGPHRQQLCKLLGITGDKLSGLILEGGLEYLASLKLEQCEAFAHDAKFWAWFKLYWYSLDDDFLHLCERGDSPLEGGKGGEAVYMCHHLDYICRIYPSSLVLHHTKSKAA